MDIAPPGEPPDQDSRAAVGCWRWEVGTQRVEWTDSLDDLLGNDVGSAAATFDKLIAHVDAVGRQCLVAALEQCSRRKQTKTLTFRVRRQDGEIRLCRAEMSSQANEDGQIVSVLGFVQDISGPDPGPDTLRHSRRIFHTIVDAMPALIGVKDRDSRYVLVNARFADYHGRPPAWFEGRTITDFYDASYARAQIEADQAVVRSGRSTGYAEVAYTESDGRIAYWLANRMPVHDESGQVEYIIDIGLDITELKQAEAARQQSQKLLNAVLDAVPVSLNLKDLDGRYVLVNAYEAKLYGRPPEWFLGRRAAEIAPSVYAGSLTERDSQVIRTAKPLGWLDDSFVDSNGRQSNWLATKLPLFDDSGKLQYVLSIGLDVTDRRRAEEDLRSSQRLLQAVMDAVPAMVCVKDREHRCIFVNAAFAAYYRKTPAWFVGRRTDELLPASYVSGKRRLEQRVLDTGQASGFFEEPFTESGGGATAWLANIMPLSDEKGNVSHLVSVGLDITERKQAEASLRESQALLRTIIDAVPATISVKDTSGNYVLVNAYQANLFGQPADWFLGKNIVDLWPADYLKQLRQRDLAVIETGRTQRYYEYDYVDADGRVSSWMGIRSPILGAAGEVSYVVSVGLDITDLRRAERAVAEGRALLQTVIDAVPAVVSVTDAEGRYVFVNEASARYHGHPPDWFPGRSLEEVHAKEYAAILRERDRRVLQGEALPGLYEEQYAEPDGRVTSWLSTDAPLRDAAGKAKYVVTVSLEITDRRRSELALKESEQRFRHLVESVGVVPYTWDVHRRRYLYIGPQVEAMFGYPHREWTDDRFWLSVIHADDLDPVLQHALEFNRDPKDDELEYRVTAADGRTVWVRDVLKIQTTEEGGLIGYGMFFDVTASKLRDQQLAQAQKMDAIGKLTGGLAHDFNNLLTVIFGNLDLLESALSGDAQQAERIRLAKKAARRGADLTHRLLAFARRQALEPQFVDINKLVQQLGELMQRTLGETVTVQMKLANNLWPVRVDPAWFESAVLNLAINSRDAMPQGGVLTFETANRWVDQQEVAEVGEIAAGPYASLTVTDTGTGMSPEVLAQAFDPFFTTKELGKGTGLGLSMVYGFVKQSGGHIRIDSDRGRGTTVRILLRRAESGAEPAAGEDAVDTSELTGTETILVVEDDASVRETAGAMLRSLGYRVLLAADGPAALNHIESQRGIALLIIDVVLAGGMNGADLAREAATRIPGIVTLFVSGYSEDARLDSRRGGAGSDWLGKPYSKADLAQKLRQLLDGRGSQRSAGERKDR